MKTSLIKTNLSQMEIGENYAEHFGDTTYAIRTGLNTWSVLDNGEEVADCDLETAVRVIEENLE